MLLQKTQVSKQGIISCYNILLFGLKGIGSLLGKVCQPAAFRGQMKLSVKKSQYD